MNMINPFSVVKANEFTITQIIDNWVPFSGSENGFVAALNPQELMPKYVLGSKGCGKTHLVNAIGTKLKELHPKMRVLYVGAHQFTVQYTDSIRNNSFNDFINFYQTIDTLIVDDIQELAGQEKTQLAFFHIFNHLKMNGKQIILTSDRDPGKAWKSVC